AARLRRFPRGRRQADRRWVDDARAARDLRRLERRPAGRRRADAMAGVVRRGGLLRPAARYGPLREVRARPAVVRRVRNRRRSGGAGLAAVLLALPDRNTTPLNSTHF